MYILADCECSSTPRIGAENAEHMKLLRDQAAAIAAARQPVKLRDERNDDTMRR